jgi:hypothetical protein
MIVLSILIGFYLVDSARKAKKEQAEKTTDNLSSIKIDEITEIALSRRGENIIFVKDQKSSVWRIENQDEGRIGTDSGNVSFLIEKLGSIQKSESLGKISSLGQYGLSEPAIILKVKTEKAENVIKLGKKTPADDGVYLMKDEDENLYVADSGILSAADKSLYDFRDKKLVNLEPDKISSFSFTVSGKTFNIEKMDDNWTLTVDKKYRADDEIVKRALNSLSSAEVKEFLKQEEGKEETRGLGKPEIQVALKDTEGRELRLAFGKVKTSGIPVVKNKAKSEPAAPAEPEKIYARSSGCKSDLLIEKTLIADLKTDLQAWKSKKIVDVPFDSINDVRIDGPEKTVAFRRTGKDSSEFEIYEPEKLRASHWECNSLNSRIANISATDFLKPTLETQKKAAFGKPYAVITFKTGRNNMNPDTKEEKAYSIIIGAAGRKDKINGRYAKVTGNDEEIYLISDDTLKEVIKTPFDLREKELIHVRADEVEKITIRAVVGKKPADIIIEKDRDKWEVSEPNELRDKNVDDILWDILSLKMDGTAVKPARLSAYSLEPPFAMVTLHLTNDKKTVIRIGGLIPGDNPAQNYLMIEGDKNIYITSTALRNVITGLAQK